MLCLIYLLRVTEADQGVHKMSGAVIQPKPIRAGCASGRAGKQEMIRSLKQVNSAQHSTSRICRDDRMNGTAGTT
jgi:hypothetical protein